MADRRTLAAVAALAALALGAGLLWAVPDLVSQARRMGSYADAEPACDLAEGPCTATFADGTEVTLDITPRGLPTETPLTLRATVEGDATPTAVELQGVDMNMGLLRTALTPDPEGGFSGRLVVPVCTTERMTWHADVVLQDRTAGFGFEVHKDTTRRPEATYGDFTVQTADGPLSLSDLRGQVVVVYFGYTSCPDICPTTLQTISSALHTLPDDQSERVTGLLVSLDPERDSLEHLDTYTSYFHPRIRGGTDQPEAIEAIAERWGIAWRRVEDTDSALGYTLDHDTRAFLVAPDGHMVGSVRHGTDAESLARQIQGLLE